MRARAARRGLPLQLLQLDARVTNVAQPPASTTVGVPALARPDALFEVEAIVMLER